MKLSEAIRFEERAAEAYSEAHNQFHDNVDPADVECCLNRAARYRQLAEWLKILKSAKFEYDEAWRTITHPTPDVTYADKQRAQVILDKFRNSLGAMK